MQPLPPDPNGGNTDPQPAGADLSGVVTPNVDLALAAFSVGAISPTSGSTLGGYQVTITGTGFDKSTRFSLDNVPLVDVQIISDTQAKGFVAKSLGSFGKVALRATRGASNDIATKADVFNFVPNFMQFKARVDLKLTSGNPYQIAVGDFNGDGKPDIASDSNGAQVPVIFINRTNGPNLVFSTPQTLGGVSGQQIGITTADFNGDGKMDLVANRYNSQLLNVYKGNGDGTFQGISQQLGYGGYNYAYHVVNGDLNGDGKPDVVVQSSYSNCTLHSFTNDGNGNFTTRTQIGTPCQPETVTLGDFDGDGKLDAAMPFHDSSYFFSIYRGNGDGTFINTRYDFNNGPSQYHIATGDLNGDGKLDLITTNYNTNGSQPHTFAVMINTSGGAGSFSFSAPVYYSTGAGPIASALADMNADGKLDAITSNIDSNSYTIYLGNGDGTFANRTDHLTVCPRQIAIADFNGDKRPDIASSETCSRAGNDGNGVAILINDAQ